MTDDEQKLVGAMCDALRGAIELFRKFQPQIEQSEHAVEARQALADAATALARATAQWRSPS
jgi:hypothetical protein